MAAGSSMAAGPTGNSTVLGSAGVASAGVAGGTSTTRSGGGAFAGASSGWGFDVKHVYLGASTVQDVDTCVASLGATSSSGNQQGDIAAVVSFVNAHGGVLGRQVVPIYHDNKCASVLANSASTDQANCAVFTQDHPVAAVLDLEGFTLNSNCLTAKKIIGLPDAQITTNALLSQRPYEYEPGAALAERYVPSLVDRQLALGYFQPWDTANGAAGNAPVKVGILYEEPDTTPFVPLITKALRAHGIQVAATFGVSVDQNAAQELSNAELQFRSKGVTHVYAFWAGEWLLFMEAAEQQHYRPRYAAIGWNNINYVAPNAPSAQMAGSLGTGWRPSSDVQLPQNPGDPSSATGLCRRILAAGRQTYPRGSIAEDLGMVVCDQLRSWASAVNAAGSINGDTFGHGMDLAGPGFISAQTFGASLSGSRRAGVAAARDLGYVTACTCYRYLSTTNRPF